MSVWKATSASPTESASTRMAPLPVLVPLATGLDLVELLVWVSAQTVSEGRKEGLQKEKAGQEEESGEQAFLEVWGESAWITGPVELSEPGGGNHGGHVRKSWSLTVK